MTRNDVRETYDRIATHFSKTRPAPWSEVVSFVRSSDGAVALDVGVGNGRHAELLAEACQLVVGLDFSDSALRAAAERASERRFDVELVQGDAVALPFVDASVDVAVYVATIHHLPTREDRVRSLNELARVLRSTGRGLVSAWCVTHERFDSTAGFDTTIDWTLPSGDVVGRFYHIYDPDEFARDIDESRLSRISSFESSGNCYAIVEPEQ